MSAETLNSPGTAEAAVSSPAEVVLPTGPVPTISEQPAPQVALKPAEAKAEETKETAGTVETKTEKEEAKGSEEPAAVEAQPEKTTEETTRLDKHPRFQEVIKEKQELAREKKEAEIRAYKAEAQYNAMAQRLEALERSRTETKPAVSIDPRSLDELIENEGTGAALKLVYEKALEDARHNVMSDVNQRSATERMEAAAKDFASKHEDFMEMFESGELSKIADESPVYNTPIAAYLKVKLEREVKSLQDAHQENIKAAVEAARKEEQAAAAKKIKLLEDTYKAKKTMTVVDEHPSTPAGKTEAITSGGDIKRTLYERHMQRLSSV